MSLSMWKLPADESNINILISILCSTSFVQLIIPNVGVITGIAKILWDVTLFLAYSSYDQIFLTLRKYSLITLTLFRMSLSPMSSPCPKYL